MPDYAHCIFPSNKVCILRNIYSQSLKCLYTIFSRMREIQEDLSVCAGQNNHEMAPGSRIPVSIAYAAMKPTGTANAYGAPTSCSPNLACVRSIIINNYASMGICLLPYWPINSCRSFDEPRKATGVAYATYCPFNGA
jgi:hypothetical protein